MSAEKNITLLSDPRLRVECSKIVTIDQEIVDLAQCMLDKMYEANGCGLAATQIGDSRLIAVIDVDWSANTEKNPFVLINPSIVERSEETFVFQEGCLSLPGIIVPVKRSRYVRVQALNLEGELMEYEGENNLLAACLQHEIDHLHGTLIADHLPAQKRLQAFEDVRRALSMGAVPGDVDFPTDTNKTNLARLKRDRASRR